jgi:NAD(P) transhydrogenase subunit alpha
MDEATNVRPGGNVLRLAILKESAVGETRVALLPDAVKSLVAKGLEVVVEAGAGIASGIADEAYAQAGATLCADRAALLAYAEILPVVNAPSADDQRKINSGCVVIGFLRPLDEPSALVPAIDRGVALFAVELVPRITRAQAMDALSSMATVAGYKAVILAADTLPRLFPMLMTAAGTVAPAKVFVIGAGVAGLQAIATARRLGAVVEAYDVRAAAGEQVRSLGAKFLDVDLGGLATEDKGGYAKELSEEALDRGRDLIAKTAKTADVIITTAQVPGRRAPLLIRRDAVENMRPGTVLVDLAASSGGNCELTRPGETQRLNGVTLFAPLNLPTAVAGHASQLYSRNIANFLALIVKDGALQINMDDEILSGSCVAREGHVVNPRVSDALANSK